MRPSFLPALLLCAALSSPPASAQPSASASLPAPSALGAPINGTIRALEGTHLIIAQADGSNVTLQLAPDTIVTAQRKAAFADIQPHDFVASAGVLGTDGRTHAQEVRIFPESMRGAGEGHRPMALPNQTMTNATVSRVGPASSMTNATVASVAGGVLTTVYPGGTTEIVVDPGTPVWKVVSADRSGLKPGAPVRVFSTKAADGSLGARYIALQ
jgi:hypothetical protein